MARKAKEDAGEARITPKKAKNAIAVAKVIGPAVLPIVAPYAVRAAGAAREAYDRYQARKLGVAVDQLGEFTGRGAALHARIAGLVQGLNELKKSGKATDADQKFAADTQGTLEQLSATVRAAERMPATRRKAAHRAVSSELDSLEEQLLHRLGV
ncbi:DUF6474 family protein [Amycolatopsis sp. FDAARGOS 1241]|uniref:DUF6474 family protein n=1 Tax=Amycolatopsis sp. FDAARGOS 1241 TaxID=2778070 RepID=UPI00195251E9|nr:DUF6474 family protein [Amycolatopsis sp. FDAARGOS 1241]QRP45943.1 hypothetical protein I6J71_43945 [Amycolatopsis sp. FDAARGOS 1241]